MSFRQSSGLSNGQPDQAPKADQGPVTEPNPITSAKLPMVYVLAAKRGAFEIDPKLDPKIGAEIESESVVKQLEKKPVYTAQSGREYRLDNGEIYYNTKPGEKNTWGKLSDDRPTYAATRAGFTELTRVTAANELPVVFSSTDNKLVFDGNGKIISANENGAYQITDGVYYSRVKATGALESSDAVGTFRQDYIKQYLTTLKAAGIDTSYEDGFAGSFGGRAIAMKIGEDATARLFSVAIGTGGDGRFAVTLKAETEKTYSKLDDVIAAATERQTKIVDLIAIEKRLAAAKTNPEAFELSVKAAEQLEAVRTSFPGSGDLAAGLANRAAWAVVEDNLAGKTELKLAAATKSIQFLEKTLEDSRSPNPNYADTVAQFYKLKFEQLADPVGLEKAVQILESTTRKARTDFGSYSEDDQKQIIANERLLRQLREQ